MSPMPSRIIPVRVVGGGGGGSSGSVNAGDVVGLGTAATHPATDFEAAGAAASALGQALRKVSNLTDLSNPAAARTALGLHGAALAEVADFLAAAARGAANGVAPLDANSKVPSANLPSAGSGGGVPGLYGDGADGPFVVGAGATVALTKDVNHTDVTVPPTGTIRTNGYRLFCAGTLTNEGLIHNGAYSNNSGAAGGCYGPGANGGNYTTTNGNPGATSSYPINASSGGKGGNAGANTGGAGGTHAAPGASRGSPRNLFTALSGWGIGSSTQQFTGGAGGGAGAGDGTNNGGFGGGGGGLLGVFAKTVVNNGTFSADGGVGQVPFTPASNCGGGGGGGGGTVFLVTASLTGTGVVRANGGKGAAPTGTGQAGVDGSPGIACVFVP